MSDLSTTIDASMHRAWMLASGRGDVLKCAEDLLPDHVILSVDARDPLGADLATRLYMPTGDMSVADFDAHAADARERVERFTAEQVGVGRVPVVTAPVRREWVDDFFRARDLAEHADRLAADASLLVVVVAAGGVLLAPINR